MTCPNKKALDPDLIVHLHWYNSQWLYSKSNHQIQRSLYVFNFNDACFDLCTVHSVQDAFDAVGYFQLALAAALEDQANPEALYVVYMKLAEIHGNHMPDAQMCQVYRDRAQKLKRVLAGEESAAVGEENVIHAESEPGQKKEEDSDDDMGHRENENQIFDSMPGDKKYENGSSPQTFMIHVGSDSKCTDTDAGNIDVKEDNNLCDTDGPYVDAFETDTVASQSYSDSIFTESFDTAKEQISDSSTSTDTLQSYQKPTDVKDPDFDTGQSMPSQIPLNHSTEFTGHADARDTYSDIQDEQNNLSKETNAK